jgi:hypothetical protein
MKCGARPRIAASFFLASLAQQCCADPAPVIHYAPAENLEHLDVALIDRAEHEIDMAAYVARHASAHTRSRSRHCDPHLSRWHPACRARARCAAARGLRAPSRGRVAAQAWSRARLSAG